MTAAHDIRSLAARLGGLAAELSALASERQTREGAWQVQRLALSEGGAATIAQARAALAASNPAAEVAAALAAVADEPTQRCERLAAIATQMRRQVRERLDRRLVQIRSDAAARSRELERQRGLSDGEVLSRTQTLSLRQRQLDAEAQRLGAICRVAATAEGGDSAPAVAPTDLGAACAGIAQQGDELQALLMALERGWVVRLCRHRLLAHGLAVLPGAIAYAILPGSVMLPVALGLVVVAVVAVWIAIASARGQAAERLAFVRATLADAQRRLDALAAAARARMGGAAMSRLDAVLQASGVTEDRERAAQTEAERALSRIREREVRLRQRIEAAGAQRIEAVRRAAGAAAEARHAAARQALSEAEAAAIAVLATADAAWHAERQRILAAATAAAATAEAELAAAVTQNGTQHPAWSDAAWSGWHPPATWPVAVPVGLATGRLHEHTDAALLAGLPDRAWTMPVALDPLGRATMALRAGPALRSQAIDLLNQTLLRFLASAPGAHLRLTLIDPVGLGQSFASLLGLADHGDAVLDGGIATDGERIDRALDQLCAHVEAVVRTRLRGTYPDLAAYNREAGDLREPVRLVAVADFPTGFGERAIERLTALVKSGARCGVHVLLHIDQRQRLQPACETALVQHAGLVLREHDGAWNLVEPALPAWRLAVPEAPAPALAGRICLAAGAAAVQANRVELSFSSVAPANAALWSLSTATSLRVPIGMSGVGKAQHLELGRGTAQHVLIGGRTGSGKSTLLHVLITSAALWHHPRELELYLIDFKKGVEFQAYAAARLPHARVVAVESDREFGLAVLRRLDDELARRGELFRAAGVQDLAAHRQSGGEHLPRTLLLIDEFQEFFTEDDTIARDAALLLDRFVRQGRAFGLHVVLGSQTLSGNYSLAKSSLGQMGVRIVLPCNESDAHLLLHEDNDAVRLLTRPGEAIYNDQAGLSDGNSPFQVCWLPDAERSERLRPLAAQVGDWAPSQPMVVFAGDAPARMEEEPALRGAPDRLIAGWVGQSSSLRGATEIAFPAASGGNLLLIGQHREGAHGILTGLALSLAVRHLPDPVQVLAIDGEEAEGPFARLWATLAAALPLPLPRWGGRDVAACLDILAAVCERRVSGEDPSRTPVLLVVNALSRIRALRPDDDAPFDRSGGEPAADRLARILAQGPEVGIHAAVWCDGLAGVQRALARRTQRDFDLRILFQMSPADSSELIDDAAASRLGLHSALLAVLSEGRREKFRPWQAPDGVFVDRLGSVLRARQRS